MNVTSKTKQVKIILNKGHKICGRDGSIREIYYCKVKKDDSEKYLLFDSKLNFIEDKYCDSVKIEEDIHKAELVSTEFKKKAKIYFEKKIKECQERIKNSKPPYQLKCITDD